MRCHRTASAVMPEIAALPSIDARNSSAGSINGGRPATSAPPPPSPAAPAASASAPVRSVSTGRCLARA
eukprot:1657977-Rhodomonas_salina.4